MITAFFRYTHSVVALISMPGDVFAMDCIKLLPGSFEVVPLLPMEGCLFPWEIMVIIIEFTEAFLKSSRNVCINQLAMLLRKRRPIVRSCIDERHQRLMRLEEKRTPVETIAVSWRPWFALEIYVAKLYATKWSLAKAQAAPTVKSLFRELVRGGHMSSTMAHPLLANCLSIPEMLECPLPDRTTWTFFSVGILNEFESPMELCESVYCEMNVLNAVTNFAEACVSDRFGANLMLRKLLTWRGMSHEMTSGGSAPAGGGGSREMR
jgi:hypothetical protein